MSATVTVTKRPATKARAKIKQPTPAEQAQALSMKLLKANLEMRPIDEQIYELQKQKEQYDEKAAQIRNMLGIVMQEIYEQTGEKKFENHLIKLTFVAPTTRTAIDTTRLKLELPKIAAKYSKTTDVKGSVRITIK